MTIRQHWAIENQQHWILDVQFAEDAHRTRKDHSAANLGLIRRIALNLLRQTPPEQNPSRKASPKNWSIRRRKMHTLMDPAYRETVLFKHESAYRFAANVYWFKAALLPTEN